MKFKNKFCVFFLILIFSFNIAPCNVFANTITSNFKVLKVTKKTVNESSDLNNLKSCDCNNTKYLKSNNNTEKEIINLLVNAYKNSITSVDLSKYKISINEIQDIVNKSYNADLLVYNCREILGYSYSFSSYDNLIRTVTFKYGNDYKEFNKEYTELSNAVSKILNSINSSMTDLEKALYVHDYIVKNSEYDSYNLNNNSLPESSYKAYGILVKHTGVCLGYANAYKLLMDKLGINCIVITSDSMNHAWNMIEINNKWYHIDVTWDDPLPDIKGRIGHNYFLVNDSEISKDHYGWSKSGTPSSNSNTFSSFILHNVNSEICYEKNNWYYMLDGSIYKADINNLSPELIKTTNGNAFSFYNNKLYYYDKNYDYTYGSECDDYFKEITINSIKSCDLNGNNESTFYSFKDNNDNYMYVEGILISDTGLMTITFFNGNYNEEITKQIITEDKTEPSKDSENVESPTISYSTHVQKIGWQDYVSDGITSGTTGNSLRLEGIKIKLNSPSIPGNIIYRTHVQKIGWQNYVNNDELSGTTGKSLRLEAIQIKLTGEISNNYDIYYRVHSQKFGWLGWAKNNEMAGTSGFGYRLEAIEIKLVPKGNTALGHTTNCYYKK